MSHECPECGWECDCDLEDHGQPAPPDCIHACDPEDDCDWWPEEDDDDDFNWTAALIPDDESAGQRGERAE